MLICICKFTNLFIIKLPIKLETMTNCTTNVLIKEISLSEIDFSNIKKKIAQLDWGILLESASPDHIDSHWSIYTAEPIATIQTFGAVSEVNALGKRNSYQTDPFELIESLRLRIYSKETTNQLPFSGGALGYISYELGYQLENIKYADSPQGLDLPDLAIGFYDWALLVDQHTNQQFVVVNNTADNSTSTDVLLEKRTQWLMQQAKQQIHAPIFKLTSNWLSNLNKHTYYEKFKQIQNYILSGDCYQINLTQRFQAHYQGDEYQAYLALLETNRPPFAAFLRLPKQTILSLSPERFIKLQNNIVESKPIKGTSPRYQDLKEDQKSQKTLMDSLKDRAENLMIVDLLRNDIGRVCKPGTVKVPKLFEIESFPAVHHLVSTVTGELAPEYSSEILLQACFPGGSITGAPKIRAMEIIAQLEPNKRQVYCGSIGYINHDGQLDMNISIRTLLCFQGQIYCWAGGGLVADSDPDQEYQECFDKVSKILPCLTKLNQ